MKTFQVTWKVYTNLAKCYKYIEKYNYNASFILEMQKRVRDDIKVFKYISFLFIWPFNTSKQNSFDTEKINTMPSILESADHIFETGRYEECYNLLKSYEVQDDVEIKWRKCRVLYNMARDSRYDITFQKKIVLQAFKIITEELDKNFDNSSVQKWDTFETNEEKHNDSIQIIETNSEPNVSYANLSLSSPDSITKVTKSDWDIDDSFLQLEKMVSEMSVSPKSNNNDVLNNTLEVVEYILKNPITKDNNRVGEFLKSDLGCVEPLKTETPIKLLNCYEKLQFYKTKTEQINEGNDNMKLLQESPIKIIETDHSDYVNTETLVATTPVKQTEHIFKTPKSLLSTKKHILASSTKKTPNKINAYQHITSPIAFYINKCPQVPLIKDVHLKKPSNNGTCIPKLIKTAKEHKTSNKENISLPSVAYKSAKETKMITIPDAKKLPSGQWVHKISTSLPKPVVIKHTHREVKPVNKYSVSKSDESFAGLPLKQADLSVCIKKTAFTEIK